MSVEKMKMKLLLGKAERLNDALSAVTSLGFVHLENAASVMADTRDFSPLNEQNQAAAVCARVEETVRLCGIDPETVAGPGPDDRGTPEGLVYIGLYYRGQRWCVEHSIGLGRERVRELAATTALDMVRRALLELPVER